MDDGKKKIYLTRCLTPGLYNIFFRHLQKEITKARETVLGLAPGLVYPEYLHLLDNGYKVFAGKEDSEF